MAGGYTNMLPSRVHLARRQIDVEYVEAGPLTGLPVVMLHGFTDSWRSFEAVLPHLPRSLRAIAVSMRGHGGSSRPPLGYRPQDLAGDLASFLDSLAVERAVIVGHSMGATVAERFAGDYPDRTVGLVLVGAFAGFPANGAIQELWAAVSSLSDPIDPEFVRGFQWSTVARPVLASFMAAMIGQSLKVPARVWRSALAGLLEDEGPRLRRRVASPTMLVWGDRDTFVPLEDQALLQDEIAGAELVVYEGAGHAVHWEEPMRFASDLSAFLARAQGAGVG
jgi:non-heme chloroperoxidase